MTAESRNPELRPTDSHKNDLRNQMFRVGDWLVDPRANRIERADDVKTLRNKAMEVLVLLASAGGRVVLREEIIEQVWDGNEFVAGKGITNTIWTLRQSLGDTAETPQYIETIAKRGYRLLAPVTTLPAFAVDEVATTAIATAAISDPTDSTDAADDRTAETDASEPAAQANRSDIGERRQSAAASPVRDATLTRGWRGAAVAVVLLLSSLAAVWWTQRTASAPVIPGTAERVAAGADVRVLQVTPEAEYPIAVAPDGNRYAYGSRLFQFQQNTLWLQSLTSDAEPVQLKSLDGYLFALAWAPDGESLAIAATNAQWQCEISVLSLQTLQLHSVGRCADSKVMGLAWSADGRFLAASDTGNSGGIAVVLIEVATGARRLLTSPARDQLDWVGDFHPDSRSLLVVRQASPSDVELWRIGVDGDQQLLWQGTDRAVAVAMDWWTPEEVLLSVGREGGEPQLHTFHPVSGRMQALGLTGISPQHLAPDGLLFVRTRQHRALTEIDLRQRPLQAVQRLRSDSVTGHPVYLDAASWIYMNNASGHMELFQGDRSGGQQQLTQLQRMAWDPAPSPDGRWLAFAGQCGGDSRSKICLQDRASGRIAVAFAGSQSVEAPRWGRDGRSLWFRMASGGQMQIGRLPVSAAGAVGQVEWLATLPTWDVYPAADDNGFYWVDRFTSGIRRRDLRTGEDQLRVAEFPAGSRQWTANGDTLYYLIRDPDRTLNVYRQASGTGSERLGSLQNLMLDGTDRPTVSVDGSHLLVTEMISMTFDPAVVQSSAGGYALGLGNRRLMAVR